ncbi:MAG: sodium:glutamate symporter [Bacteroidales bacterium]|nr:sodium:glutamate symporter [Bacteroidales bacterium]
MTFTPWTLLIDVGIVSLLLLLGKLLRSKVRLIQKFFIPPSLLAGLTALLLGPEVLGWLPLSDNLGTYAGILIALVFSCIPLTSAGGRRSDGTSRIGRMWAYSQAGLLLQWAFGGALGLWVLSRIWPVHESFGLSMPAGFCGGHGTAAAIGESFASYGVDEMQSLAMTAATVGIIASVVIGMWLISWGAARGKTQYICAFEKLSPELRTGILPPDKRVSMGKASFSAISLDSMTFNFAVVAMIALGGYGLAKLISLIWPALMLPVFSCAFIVGILIRWILARAKVEEHISKPIIGHLSGAFTDYLVAFGVASIKLQIVGKFVVPLLVLLAAGLVVTLFYVFWVGNRIHKSAPFEKSIFTWGWFTGTMAMGIALLRITDPDSKSGCLDDYAFAYLYIAPVEIALVSLSPLAFCHGLGWLFVTVCLMAGVAILGLAVAKGWLKKPSK